jgi:hypothetical protein
MANNQAEKKTHGPERPWAFKGLPNQGDLSLPAQKFVSVLDVEALKIIQRREFFIRAK